MGDVCKGGSADAIMIDNSSAEIEKGREEKEAKEMWWCSCGRKTSRLDRFVGVSLCNCSPNEIARYLAFWIEPS